MATLTAKISSPPAAPGAARPAALVLDAGVAGWSMCRCPAADLPALRRTPGPVPEGWGRCGASVLRHSDEQAVAGVAAVFTAVAEMGGDPSRFADWAVVSASRHVGRTNVGDALTKFAAEGVWGISPHLIPHYALHSSPGTISLALGFHGPALGVGGGNRPEAEGYLAALTWLAGDTVPGAWLVLSVPTQGESGACAALALALTRPSPGDRASIRLTVGGVLQGRRAVMGLAHLAEVLALGTVRKPLILAADPAGNILVELLPGRAGELP